MVRPEEKAPPPLLKTQNAESELIGGFQRSPFSAFVLYVESSSTKFYRSFGFRQVALKALNERLAAKGGVGMSKSSSAPHIPQGKTTKASGQGANLGAGGIGGSKERLIDV